MPQKRLFLEFKELVNKLKETVDSSTNPEGPLVEPSKTSAITYADDIRNRVHDILVDSVYDYLSPEMLPTINDGKVNTLVNLIKTWSDEADAMDDDGDDQGVVDRLTGIGDLISSLNSAIDHGNE
ncbi:MAG: hypothetical protein O7G85_02090 [Planctomycetota bacterium]|nr:hypothetical protein [Planctomycetota bacterium]